MALSVAWKDGSLCVKKEKATMRNSVAALHLKQEMGVEAASSSAQVGALWCSDFGWCVILSRQGIRPGSETLTGMGGELGICNTLFIENRSILIV